MNKTRKIAKEFLNRFCRECGSKMTVFQEGAEKYLEYYGDDDSHPFHKYNKHTGERQFILYFACPRKRRKWADRKHDEEQDLIPNFRYT